VSRSGRRAISGPGFLLFLIVPLALILAFGYFLWKSYGRSSLLGFIHSGLRDQRVVTWLNEPGAHPEWAVTANQRCASAPFSIPTSGYIGYLWGDSFRPGHQHQGIDIFGGNAAGLTPVYAAYPGYLTRQSDWKSSLIVRIPDDPLHPGRQIWTYYTHMASPDGESYISADFPVGSFEQPVEAGRLLGYQGNYSGDPGNPVGVHLHFSIVLDDGQGRYLNELQIQNTLDPSAYLGLPLDANSNSDQIPVCP
jgi:murein DD-endopeptidase MepM/ murein hydrolase activator NlpD